MNLLLILSALLTALTGVAAAGRVPDVRLHQAAASITRATVAVSAAERRVVRHPVIAGFERISTPTAVSTFTVDVPAMVPLYMARRRE